MKQISNMSDLFNRLNDLKFAFKYGQELIPMIQSIIDFVKETVPLLEDINSSIADSTNKIPRVRDQINNISDSTELATTEILDIVDSISNDISNVEEKIKASKESESERQKHWNEIKEILNKSGHTQLIDSYESSDQNSILSSEILNTLGGIKQKVYNITLSLQVQDITSQQLASVNHLIEAVRAKLSSLILLLDDKEISNVESANSEVCESTTFDPNASYSKSPERQELVDDLVKNNLDKTSQEEIDKLFS
ncbi:MAG TPA: hypothetical protein ENI57_08960 [Ignavibacteria bacterium]|nr:hypothetical protein [Ignavibacteria bacterium]